MLTYWIPERKNEWNAKVAQSLDGGFLQSWEWGEFQEKLGNAVYNLSNEEETILAQCLVMKAGSQFLLYIPRGPIVLEETANVNAFFSDVKAFAKKQHCFLVRFDPAWSEMKNIPGAEKAARERQPVHTLRLDTSLSEEDLLKNMKSKWRYNVRIGEKKGVEAKWSNKPQDAKMFAKLMEQTTSRQDFASYDETYFTQMMEALGPSGNLQFLFAEYKARIIAGLLVAFFGNTAIYLHGASDYEFRNLMAPHFLQWEAIKEAKRKGMDYDFWGVATNPPSTKQEEHWGGITKFKTGFTPQTKITGYVGTYEFPVKKMYYFAYKFRNKLKK